MAVWGIMAQLHCPAPLRQRSTAIILLIFYIKAMFGVIKKRRKEGLIKWHEDSVPLNENSKKKRPQRGDKIENDLLLFLSLLAKKGKSRLIYRVNNARLPLMSLNMLLSNRCAWGGRLDKRNKKAQGWNGVERRLCWWLFVTGQMLRDSIHD